MCHRVLMQSMTGIVMPCIRIMAALGGYSRYLPLRLHCCTAHPTHTALQWQSLRSQASAAQACTRFGCRS